ncbi:MAG TPA: hypothetical protein PKY87_08915 [Terricaulis sp.]|nr:hypothetical protein [Terricaulis sp.]
MSTMPAFQFYPADWQANPNLRRCTHEEKGVWIDVMCLLHDQAEYGVIRWPLAEIATAVGSTPKKLRGLITKGVLKGADKGECEPFVYTPRSGGKDGEPVALIEAQEGPIWYSSRMVKDAYVRQRRGSSTRFDDDGNQPQKRKPKAAPKDTPNTTPKPPLGADIGTGLSDGPSSSSSSSDSPLPPKGADGGLWLDRMKLIAAKVPNLDRTSPGAHNPSPLKKLEADGCDFDADIFPALVAIGEAWNRPTPIRSLSLPSFADMAHANRERRMAGHSTADAKEWQRRLLNWRADRTWHASWGPNPEQPGYLGPASEAA